MTRVTLVLAAMIDLNWFTAAAAARDVLPVRLEQVPPGSDDLELHIAGEVAGSHARTVVLRVDDGRDSDYGSRVNDERKLRPGQFSWTVQLKGLRTINNRVIDHRDIRQILLFDNDDSGQVQVDVFRLEPASKSSDSRGDISAPPNREREAAATTRHPSRPPRVS